MELARHSCASLTMEVYASADKARLRQAAEAAARHIEDNLASSPCCPYVAHEKNGEKRKVVKQVPPRTCVGSKMVGATGFEPATPRPPVIIYGGNIRIHGAILTSRTVLYPTCPPFFNGHGVQNRVQPKRITFNFAIRGRGQARLGVSLPCLRIDTTAEVHTTSA